MKTHIIRWVSSITGGIGSGKKLFEKEEAEQLASELNLNYPDIDHEAIPAASSVEPGIVPAHTDAPSALMAGLIPILQTEAGLSLPKPVGELST